MTKLRTPYACGICEIEFCNPIFLIKHVEVRHLSKSRNFSTFTKTNIQDAKTNLLRNSKEKSTNSKNSDKPDNIFEFVSTNVVEIEPNTKKLHISKNGNCIEKDIELGIKIGGENKDLGSSKKSLNANNIENNSNFDIQINDDIPSINTEFEAYSLG